MKIFFLSLIIIALFGCEANQQNDKIVVWQKMIGGSGDDIPMDVIQTSEGGFIIAGRSTSDDIPDTEHKGASDFYLVKLDSDGNILWQKMYGDILNDQAESIYETSDGGYIIAGKTTYSAEIDTITWNGEYVCYILKVDNNGEIQWQNAFGGSDEDMASQVLQTSDNGYIVAGYSRSDDIPEVDTSDLSYPDDSYANCYIVKLDVNGTIQWQKLINMSDGWGAAFCINERTEGGYIIAGNISSINPLVMKGYFITIDEDGTLESQTATTGGPIVEVLQTPDGSYLGAAQYDPPPSTAGDDPSDIAIVRVNSAVTGYTDIEYFGGSEYDAPRSIKETEDEGYIVAGASESNDIPDTENHGSKDFYILKIDNNLELLWQFQYGGSGYDDAQSIVQTSDSGYIVVGQSDSTDIDGVNNHGGYDFYIMKLNNLGVID